MVNIENGRSERGSDYRNTAGMSPRRPRTLRVTGTHTAEPPRRLGPG